MEIKIDDLTGPEVAKLLQEHLDEMALHSPAESRHALDLTGLQKPEITFWSIWEGGELIGCGALKEMDTHHGEVKSMRTTYAHRGRGIGRKMLQHIIAEAERRGYKRLSLETGSMAAFEPARQMYARFGFEYCDPFGSYKLDPNSVFMTKELT